MHVPSHLFAGSHDKSNIIGSPLAGRLFVIMGAGGAGKALAYGAKQKGARIIIANRKYGTLRSSVSLSLLFQ